MTAGLLALATASPAQAAAPKPPAPATTKGARDFIDSLYARYRDSDFCAMCLNGRHAGAPLIFDPALLALLRENERVTPQGEMGAIEADPLCRCQDPDGLRARIQTITLGPPAQGAPIAHAEVGLRYGPAPSADAKTVALTLVYAAGHWRVHDVGGDQDSFRALLETSNRDQRAAKAGRP